MPVYPIALRKKSMLHRQGTKEYHQVLIVNGEGRAVVIQRWGKKNAEGQMRVDAFHHSDAAVAEFESKDRDKKRNGYEHDPARDTIVQCDDEADFRKKLGILYLSKLGPDNLEHIAPGADTTGVRTPDPQPEFDRDGKIVRKGYQPRHKFTDFVEPAGPSVADEVAHNENWGTW
ncbi:WGR domain-containing protein [Methylobacterium oryzae]|uniref:WGR domain-containing protein n=1 Tax=Methylobacterium oryzae TaxID=334852 RepID=UPI001F351553|nr:WGR domain-containing protein [Methylobacterium oryzae]UIN38314.1 WGR domain-containing protein [Methylobacterium oryzae]